MFVHVNWCSLQMCYQDFLLISARVNAKNIYFKICQKNSKCENVKIYFSSLMMIMIMMDGWMMLSAAALTWTQLDLQQNVNVSRDLKGKVNSETLTFLCRHLVKFLITLNNLSYEVKHEVIKTSSHRLWGSVQCSVCRCVTSQHIMLLWQTQRWTQCHVIQTDDHTHAHNIV